MKVRYCKKSFETFADVFGNIVTYGIFSGESKEMDANFVFATNLTMCNSLDLFSKSEFDYIIIDECHYATAILIKTTSNPNFCLGLLQRLKVRIIRTYLIYPIKMSHTSSVCVMQLSMNLLFHLSITVLETNL